SGATDTLDVEVAIADVNRLPVIAATNHVVLLGQRLQFTIGGTDPDSGETLTFSSEGRPEGASINATTGAFDWTPGPGQAGDYLVLVNLTDGQASTTRALVVRATTEPQLPDVSIELTPSFAVVPGQKVAITVLADAFSGIASRSLTADGVPVALDDHGRATFFPAATGRVTLLGTATDLDGFTRTVERVLRVRDAADTTAPLVGLDPTLAGRALIAPRAIAGTVSDQSLDTWKLEIAPLGSERFATLVESAALPTSAILATIDPASLENGFYVLRLSAMDLAGRSAQTLTEIEIRSTAKSGAYTRQDVDFVDTLAGHQIAFLRQYDSLGAASD